MFEANPEGKKISYIPFDTTARANLLIAGIDIKLHKDVSLIPNVEYVFYDKENNRGVRSDDIKF